VLTAVGLGLEIAGGLLLSLSLVWSVEGALRLIERLRRILAATFLSWALSDEPRDAREAEFSERGVSKDDRRIARVVSGLLVAGLIALSFVLDRLVLGGGIWGIALFLAIMLGAALAVMFFLFGLGTLLRWVQPAGPEPWWSQAAGPKTDASAGVVTMTEAEKRLGRIGFLLLMLGIVLQSLVNFMQ
jgi:hypothetical protein